MTVRNEPLDSGDTWINCEFQVPEGFATPDQMNALGGTLMHALMEAEWCRDPSVSTWCGGDLESHPPPGGDFSFVIKKDYVFPPAPGKPEDN